MFWTKSKNLKANLIMIDLIFVTIVPPKVVFLLSVIAGWRRPEIETDINVQCRQKVQKSGGRGCFRPFEGKCFDSGNAKI